jgi:elongation factor Ts
MVKELRDRTGAGIMDTKRALDAAGGVMEEAEKALAEKGLATAMKKGGRETSEGVIQSYVHTGNRIGAMVELNCETDFVARTPEFNELARDLAMQVAAMSPIHIERDMVPEDAGDVPTEEVLTEQQYIKDPGKTVSELVTEMIARVGENVRIRRIARFELGD